MRMEGFMLETLSTTKKTDMVYFPELTEKDLKGIERMGSSMEKDMQFRMMEKS